MGAVKFMIAVKEFGQPLEAGEFAPGWPKNFPPLDVMPGYTLRITDNDSGGGFDISTALGDTLGQDGSGGTSNDDWQLVNNLTGQFTVATGSAPPSGPRGGQIYVTSTTGTPAGHTRPAKSDVLENITASADGIGQQSFTIPDDAGNPVNVTVYFKKYQADIA